MGDSRDPRKKLASLENPRWLTNLVAAFPNRVDLHVQFVLQYQAQVENERLARLAQLSAATASHRAKIAAKALEHRGRREWRLDVGRTFEGPEGDDAYLPLNNKCNLFVYEMLSQAGARVPLIPYGLEKKELNLTADRLRPPLAGEWADPRHDIPGFEVLQVPPDVPQPGDVAAIAHESWDATGHVGIVVDSPEGTPNRTVSGRADGVVYENWGFRGAENTGDVVFRRYVGRPDQGGSSLGPGIKRR